MRTEVIRLYEEIERQSAVNADVPSKGRSGASDVAYGVGAILLILGLVVGAFYSSFWVLLMIFAGVCLVVPACCCMILGFISDIKNPLNGLSRQMKHRWEAAERLKDAYRQYDAVSIDIVMRDLEEVLQKVQKRYNFIFGVVEKAGFLPVLAGTIYAVVQAFSESGGILMSLAIAFIIGLHLGGLYAQAKMEALATHLASLEIAKNCRDFRPAPESRS